MPRWILLARWRFIWAAPGTPLTHATMRGALAASAWPMVATPPMWPSVRHLEGSPYSHFACGPMTYPRAMRRLGSLAVRAKPFLTGGPRSKAYRRQEEIIFGHLPFAHIRR